MGFINSRYKDFYDIYILAIRFDFKGENLRKAMAETFEHRRVSLVRIVAFEEEFIDDVAHKSRWMGLLKSRRADVTITFEECINFIKHFLEPVLTSISNNEHFDKAWDHKVGEWK